MTVEHKAAARPAEPVPVPCCLAPLTPHAPLRTTVTMAALEYEATAEDILEEMEDDEEEQAPQQEEQQQQQPATQRLRSAVVAADGDGAATGPSGKQKGRGFRDPGRGQGEDVGNARFETLETSSGTGPAKSVEGWVLFVTGGVLQGSLRAISVMLACQRFADHTLRLECHSMMLIQLVCEPALSLCCC